MKKILAATAAVACVIGLTGCDQTSIAAQEAQVGQVVAAIKNGAKVTTDSLVSGINIACSRLGDVNASKIAVQAVIAGAAKTPGPKTAQNLARVDQAVAAANAICSQSTMGTGNTVANLLLLWGYYTSASNAVAAAKQSGGTT